MSNYKIYTNEKLEISVLRGRLSENEFEIQEMTTDLSSGATEVVFSSFLDRTEIVRNIYGLNILLFL